MSANSVSEAARDILKTHAISIPFDLPADQQKELLEEVTIMQGSIWEYSDSQPWFLVGLHKNNPTATRHALESLMHLYPNSKVDARVNDKRRGTLTLDDTGDVGSVCDSAGHANASTSQAEEDDENAVKSHIKPHTEVKGKPMTAAQELFTNYQRFNGSPQTKIVIKKTVELIGDMSKSCELVFHAVRACARFLTYPTPSVPSDNFVFGHIKGWIWLIYKGLSHFSHNKIDRKGLDDFLQLFRKEMSLLAKEAHICVTDLQRALADLKKVNITVNREAKLLKKRNKVVWQTEMERYLHFLVDIRGKHQLLVDIQEDRFFPTDWIFEPHPSKTKLHWDFFHFQWVDLRRDWIDYGFEVRSDFSLHWTAYTAFHPTLQSEIIVHLIQHVKALIEECHHFHKLNLHLSFDSQEIKFLKFAVHEIFKMNRHRDSVEFITHITKKLFEDLAVLEKICQEYVTNMEWVFTIIEPCYNTMNRWLVDDLILPLEYPGRRRTHRKWMLCGCFLFQKDNDFLELFGEPMNVVLLRSPISMDQKHKFFPPNECLQEINLLQSHNINSYGISSGYGASLFDSGLGRGAPLPIHHPLPKYKKRREQKINIFDIHRLIGATIDCMITDSKELTPNMIVKVEEDVDIEKYLTLMEEVQRFFAVFSTIFSFMMVDLKDRVEALESLMYNNLPELYETLTKLLWYEAGKPIEGTEMSGVKAVGRLHKIFQFLVYFLDQVNDLGDNEPAYYAAKTAYYRSYAKVQSWIYQKAALFSMYSLPTKREVFISLFSDKERAAGVSRNIDEFLDEGHTLIEICDSIFKGRNIVIQ